jgi:hypothetical protein
MWPNTGLHMGTPSFTVSLCRLHSTRERQAGRAASDQPLTPDCPGVLFLKRASFSEYSHAHVVRFKSKIRYRELTMIIIIGTPRAYSGLYQSILVALFQELQ